MLKYKIHAIVIGQIKGHRFLTLSLHRSAQKIKVIFYEIYLQMKVNKLIL